MAIVKNWFNKFTHGSLSVSDEPRSGAPKPAIMGHNAEKIHDLVLADHLLGGFDDELQKKSALPPLQRASSHLRLRHGRVGRTGYEVIPHPGYFLDLAPGDLLLLSKLKRSYARQKYLSVEEVIAATSVLGSSEVNVFF